MHETREGMELDERDYLVYIYLVFIGQSIEFYRFKSYYFYVKYRTKMQLIIVDTIT